MYETNKIFKILLLAQQWILLDKAQRCYMQYSYRHADLTAPFSLITYKETTKS